MSIPEIVSLSKDCAVGLAAITAIFVGLKGLAAWRRELRGKSEIDLATDLLKSVYRVELALASVRDPVGYDHERPKHLREKLTLTADERNEANQFKFETRWKQVDEATRSLFDRYLDARVMWGAEFAETFEPLRRCVNKLQWEISTYIYPELGGEKPGSEGWKKMRQIIFGHANRGTEFDLEIADAIDEFEKRLLPIIPGRKWKKRRAKRKKNKALEP